MDCTPEAIMVPQLGVGGSTPTPIKLSPASSRMALGTTKVIATRMTGRQFGRRCFLTRNQPDAPARRDARTYSALLRASTCDLTRREVVSQQVKPSVNS